MPEVIINGPEGRIECRYMPADAPDAPTALILHPEPDKGGTQFNAIKAHLESNPKIEYVWFDYWSMPQVMGCHPATSTTTARAEADVPCSDR